MSRKFNELRSRMNFLSRLRASAIAAETLKQMEATEGDLPIGTEKIDTGEGINNYVPPSLPVQGAAQRLLDDEQD